MAKKISFDNLPAAVEKILELLQAEGSNHSALSEMIRRLALLEKKVDDIRKTVSPHRPVMDMATVCRVLKLRPKAVNELAESGTLPSHTEGRKTFFYEDDVVKFYTRQPGWQSAKAAPNSAASTEQGEAPMAFAAEGRQRIEIEGASRLLGRSKAAVYQLTASNRVPFHKEGSKVYFFTDELRQWLINHPPRKRRKKE